MQDSTTIDALGFTWDRSAVPKSIPKIPAPEALQYFRNELPAYVWEAGVLEGNTYSLVEVQTLLEGVTVGGHKISEERQILNLAAASEQLHNLVRNGEFTLSKEVADSLHSAVAQDEAIESGHFRGEGRATGGGEVRCSNGATFTAPVPGINGVNLINIWNEGLSIIANIADPLEKALVFCSFATRTQFYFDGNKRTARNLMNGLLLSTGIRAISIPAAARQEYNFALDRLFLESNASWHIDFLNRARPDNVRDSADSTTSVSNQLSSPSPPPKPRGARGSRRIWVPALIPGDKLLTPGYWTRTA